MQLPSEIELTAKEREALSKIDFGRNSNQLHENYSTIAKNMRDLTLSLLEREAIPEIRKRYFTDPKLNIGRTNKSRKEIFESNGTKGEEIFKHLNFRKYLRYFIFGPELPKDTIQKFVDIIENEILTSGELLERLRSFARSETRRLNIESKKAAKEFYKLALECDLNEGLARSIRDTVRTVK